MKEHLKKRFIRVSTEPLHEDDFSFKIGDTVYFMDKAVGEEKDFSTAQALRELNAERKKIIALEKKFTNWQSRRRSMKDTTRDLKQDSLKKFHREVLKLF